MDEWFSTPAVLASTVGTATILAYLMMRSERSSQPAYRDERFKGNEYFSAVVGEVAQMNASGGAEQGCRWSQTDDEVEICVPLAAGIRAKECQCKVHPDKLTVTVQGSVVVQGKLFRRVKADEVDWSIEESNGERMLKLNLVKSVPTRGLQHWRSLLLPPEV